MRVAQIKSGVVQSIWEGSAAPIAPDGTWVFVDVTSRDARLGDNYATSTDTFSRRRAPAQFPDAITRLVKKAGA